MIQFPQGLVPEKQNLPTAEEASIKTIHMQL